MRAWEFAASRALPLCFLGAGYLALSVFLLLWGLPGQVWLSVSILFAAAVALAAAYGLYFLVSWLIAARQVMVKQMKALINIGQ